MNGDSRMDSSRCCLAYDVYSTGKVQSRDDLGRRFPDRRPAREGASGENGCVATLLPLGPSHSWLVRFDDFLLGGHDFSRAEELARNLPVSSFTSSFRCNGWSWPVTTNGCGHCCQRRRRVKEGQHATNETNHNACGCLHLWAYRSPSLGAAAGAKRLP